jgi:hypothetical protein
MWSLPSIDKLNKRAVDEHRKRKGRAPSPRGKTCECCDSKAKYMIAWHDNFGDAKTREIPKGYIPVCEKCNDDGRWQEGYFDCADCGKTFIENYTWELYYQDADDGRICLECAFDRALDSDDPDENPWVYQEDVDRLEKWLKAGEIDLAFEWLRNKVKHLIGVEMTYWEDRLIFQANVTLDSSTGGTVRGFQEADSGPAAGLREILDHLKKVLVNTTVRDFLVNLGAPAPEPARVALILDGGYQFCCSLGIYFERKYSGAKAKEVRHANSSL